MVSIIVILLLLLPFAASMPAADETSEIEKLTLDAALAEALEHNLELLSERAQMPIVESRMTTARLRPNPTLNFTADHLDLLGTGFSEINGAGPSELSVSTEFLWERNAKRKRRIQAAEKERIVAEHSIRDSVRRLTYEVQSSFVDLLLAQESHRLASENLAALTRIAHISEARVKAGDLSEVELMRVKVAVLDLENAVGRADQTLRASRSRLRLLLGRSGPARLFEASGEFRRQAIAPEETEHTALKQRPDFLAAEAEEARADAEVRLQLSQSHADFTLGSEYRRQQDINGKGNSLGFTVSLPLPIFNKNQGEIARAQAEKNRAALKTATLRAQVITEIRAALDQSETARAQLDRIESVMLVQARRVREIMNYSYQRGEASLLQFLDAERAYNDTMQSYANARAEYARSLYLYESAIGKEVRP